MSTPGDHRPPAPGRGVDVRTTLREAWRRSGGWSGLVAALAPTAVFVAVSLASGLVPAVIAAALTAAAVFAAQLLRGEPLRGAVAGLAIAVVCAVTAALTGDDRAFFLLPTATPAVLTLACLGTVVARRPLTGLAFNRIAGGPASWRDHPALLRVYDVTTVLAAGLSAVNFGLRAFFYAADQTAVLAVVYAVTGPVVVLFAAGTLVAARRRIGRGPGPGGGGARWGL